MKYTAYYAIRCKRELLELVERSELLDAIQLVEPILWINDQGGRTIFTVSDYTTAVKKLYASYVKYVILGKDKFVKLFGTGATDEVFFDRWWTVEVFDGFDAKTTDVIQDLKAINPSDLDEIISPVFRTDWR